MNKLTVNRLAAIMLAIPVEEVNENKSEATSPMALSRADGWSSRNRNLYSHDTLKGEERAHWNPGVGLWQLDTFTGATNLNHAQRANTAVGGLVVAKFFRDAFCTGNNDNELKKVLDDYWHGCDDGGVKGQCYVEYGNIYKADEDCSDGMGNIDLSDNDCLNVDVKAGSDKDGGVQARSCRWSGETVVMHCYLYDVDDATKRQGWMGMDDKNGRRIVLNEGTEDEEVVYKSPLAAPFISFTDEKDDIKFAVFPKSSTGYDNTIIKAVPKGSGARDASGGWHDNHYNGKVLQVQNCPSRREGCVWVNTATVPAPARPSGLSGVGRSGSGSGRGGSGGSIVLSWSDPGDSSITGYQYKIRHPDTQSRYGSWIDISGSGASTTGHTITGLAGLARYSVRLRAVNAAGAGPDAVVRSVRTDPPAPAAPAGLSATAAAGSVALSWNNPSDGTITRYEVRVRPASVTGWWCWTRLSYMGPSSVALTVSRLSSSTAYRFQLRAVNIRGAGAASEVSATTLAAASPPASAPAAPSGLTSTGGDRSIALSWNNPGDSSIVEYQFRERPAGETAWRCWRRIWNSTSASTGHTMGWITNGVNYQVQVRALNAAGTGPSSQTAATPNRPRRTHTRPARPITTKVPTMTHHTPTPQKPPPPTRQRRQLGPQIAPGALRRPATRLKRRLLVAVLIAASVVAAGCSAEPDATVTVGSGPGAAPGGLDDDAQTPAPNPDGAAPSGPGETPGPVGRADDPQPGPQPPGGEDPSNDGGGGPGAEQTGGPQEPTGTAGPDDPAGPVAETEADDGEDLLVPGDDVPFTWLIEGRAVRDDAGNITFPGGKYGGFWWEPESLWSAVLNETLDMCDDNDAYAAALMRRLGPGEEIDPWQQEEIETLRWVLGADCSPGGRRYVYMTEYGPGPAGVSPQDTVEQLSNQAKNTASYGKATQPPGIPLGYYIYRHKVHDPADEVVVLADSVTVTGGTIRGLIQNRSRTLWARDATVAAGGQQWRWPLTMQPEETAPFEIHNWAGATDPAAINLTVTADLTPTVDISRAIAFAVTHDWYGTWNEYLNQGFPASAVPDPPTGAFGYTEAIMELRVPTSHPQLASQINNQTINDLRAYVAFFEDPHPGAGPPIKVTDVIQITPYDSTIDNDNPIKNYEVTRLPDLHEEYGANDFKIGFVHHGYDQIWTGGAQ